VAVEVDVGVKVALLVGVLVAVGVEIKALTSLACAKPIIVITVIAITSPRTRPIMMPAVCLSTDAGNNKGQSLPRPGFTRSEI
jgi:hypothetical protein